MKRLFCALIIPVVFASGANAWWSFERDGFQLSTHRKISEQAISLVDPAVYPDVSLAHFGQTIIDATSGDVNDAIAHGKEDRDDAGEFNGGDFKGIWLKAKDDLYQNGKFSGNLNAYFRIGSMAHLVQDQAIPAHAANIYHGQTLNDVVTALDSFYGINISTSILGPMGGIPTDPDDLEEYAAINHLASSANYYYYSSTNTADYYYQPTSPITAIGIIPATQAELPTWRSPTYNTGYWYKNGLQPYLYTGQAFFPNTAFDTKLGWGTYGGPGGTDVYAYTKIVGYTTEILPQPMTEWVTDSPEIAQNQINDAAAYTAGMLMAVSKSLPPVVQSPSINGVSGSIVTVNPGQANTIAFTLLDNRTKGGSYRLLVDEHDVSSSQDIVSTQTIALGDNPDLTSLPYSSAITLTWNGLLASGSPITARADGGPHTLYITGQDGDQNPFTYVISSFTVAGGPFVTVTGNGTPYVRFSGNSNICPASINPASYGGTVNISMDPNGAPVARLVVKDPSGIETPFTYPAADVTQTHVITAPADGRYELTATDTAGNRTFAAFSLGTSVLAALPEGSTAAYDGSADMFSAQFKYHLADYYPLEKAELYDKVNPSDGLGTLARTDLLGGNSADIAYSFPALFGTGGFTRDFNLNPASATYKVKMYNAEGQVRDEVFTLSGASRMLATSSIDLLSDAGLLTGAMGRTKAGWVGVGVNDYANINIPGPVVNFQSVGSYTVSALTGQKADLSDGVKQTLATGNNYYSVWDFNVSSTPPQNCTGSVGADTILKCQNGALDPVYCKGYVYCQNQTILPPTALKRYNKIVTDISPAQLTGIFRYMCDYASQSDPNYCNSGHQPGLTQGITALEAWGVGYQDGRRSLGGGMGALVPVGANVTVELASWLSLTFENVTNSGYVEASLTGFSSMPGVLPLNTLNLHSAGLAYTGSASVSIKYNGAGITDQQAAFMEALKVNDISSRDLTPYPVIVDKTAQRAVFNTPALGDFMLEVPSYPAPYMYASADLVGTAPGLGLLAGEPGVTLSLVAPGSPMELNNTAVLNNHNLVPAGGAYLLGPAGKSFPVPAAVRMAYDKAALAQKKLIETSLAIYQISEDGAYISRLGNAVLNPNKGEITAEVSQLHSIFVIAGSTEPAPPAPLTPDITAPVSNLAFGIPAYEAGGLVLISSAAPVFVDAYDPLSAGSITSGVATSYYLLDASPDSCTGQPTLAGPSGTCQNPVYSAPFTLSAGTHTVWYRSDDYAGNGEAVKNRTLYVDGDAPVVTVSAAGQALAPGATAYITEADSITLTGLDPALNGPASGVGMMVFDVSTFSCLGFAKYPQAPGMCREILYTGAFSLPVGTSTVYYSAMDNVGNRADVNSANIVVRPSTTLSVIGKTAVSLTWGWTQAPDAAGYQLFASTGGAVSGVLPSSATYFIQTGLAPNTQYGTYLSAQLSGRNFSTVVSSAVTLANPPGVPEIFSIGQYPSLVIGQQNLSSTGYGSSQNTLMFPSGSVLDSEGNLWVADSDNFRVLRFPAPLSTGMNADIVLGQADFSSVNRVMSQNNFYNQPMGIAVDKEGKLWVSETCRILRFSPPFSSGMNADLVIGGPSFTSCYSGTSAASLGAWGIRFDSSGNLWGADPYRNRVLRFHPPFSNGMNADLVIGQPSFTSSNSAFPPASNSLSFPTDMGVDSQGDLFVSDRYNDRVMLFKPPLTIGMSASAVIGQGSFGANNQITGDLAPSSWKLNVPVSVVVDGYDNLYVADTGNNRVLKFRPPFSTGMAASLVLGQPDFNTNLNLNIANGFNQPFDADLSGFIASDMQGRLWVSDFGNNRILAFDPVHTGIFTSISESGVMVNWLANGNPDKTRYQGELSPNADFSAPLYSGSGAGLLNYAFTRLAPNSKYYARAKAANSDGLDSAYSYLNFTFTMPAAVSGFTGTANSENSILWSWPEAAGLKYQLLSSTGGAISALLGEGTTTFLQTGLEPDKTYFAAIRAINLVGFADSPVSQETTFSAQPKPVEPFVSGQNAGVVLGQKDFTSALQGLGADKFGWPFHVTAALDGNVWVKDTRNCRVLRFSAPQSIGQSADLVIGQSDFVSAVCGTAPNRLAAGGGNIAFDAAGNMWLADSSNNRVLRFSKPFANAMNADLVLGQTDLYGKTGGIAVNKMSMPSDLAFDTSGALWVSNGSRVLRFTPPFSSGMNADLVLGQPDFTSNYQQTVSTAYFSPVGIAFDPGGSLWVAAPSYCKDRLLKFPPPFSNGMAPGLVMNSTSCLTSGPSYFMFPQAVAFDNTGGLYVADSSRVLKFDPPFSSGMNAAVVIGKPDFYSLTAPLSAGGINAASDVSIGETAAGHVLWLADYANYRVLGFFPTASSFSDIYTSSAAIHWDGGANPAGTEYMVQLATAPVFSGSIKSSAWVNTTSLIFTGLADNTTYYAQAVSRNTKGISGSPAYLGGFTTLKVIQYITVGSTVVVNGSPEIIFTSTKQASVVLLSTVSGTGAVALGGAAAAGINIVSGLYQIGPDGVYNPPAMLTFSYSTAAASAVGILEDDLAIYEYFADRGWVKLAGQILDPATHEISVPVTQIASLFGVFGTARDRTAPATELSVSGAKFASSGKVYISTDSLVVLSAFDPVVYGTASGVAFTEYRLTPSTPQVFNIYGGPFQLPAGNFLLGYYSADKAGNTETAKVSALSVDALAPVTSAAVFGTQGNKGWYVSTPTVVLNASDDLSGVATTLYSVNGATFSVYASSIVFSSDGVYNLGYYSRDNVDNAEAAQNLSIMTDKTAPVSSFTAVGAFYSDGKRYVSRNTGYLRLAATDVVSGVDAEYYLVSVSSSLQQTALSPAATGLFNIYSGTFTLDDGVYFLDYAASDKAGNFEKTRSESVYFDNTAPKSSSSIMGPTSAGAAGLYVSTTAVIGFTAVEPPSSGAASGLAGLFVADSTTTYSVYAGTFSPTEGAHLCSYYAVDRLGNSEVPNRLAILADGTPPAVSVLFSTAAGNVSGRIAITSNTWIGFSAQDILSSGVASGVGAVWYSVDGATAAVFASTFTLTIGAHDLSYWAVDNVGNIGAAQKAALQVAGAVTRQVILGIDPAVINLKSEGKGITATLSVATACKAGFDAASIGITKINDVEISTPIYAQLRHGNDKPANTLVVIFDRQALIKALPVDMQVKITMEGAFTDGVVFSAYDYIRVINPGRIGKGKGGSWRGASGGSVDIPDRAPKTDFDISVIDVFERDDDRAPRDARALAKGLLRRGDPYEFGPDGSQFDVPVTISLPYAGFDPKTEVLVIGYWNPGSGDWEVLPSATDMTQKVVKASVTHFSMYQVLVSTQIPKPVRAMEAAAAQAAVPAEDFRLGEVYVYPNPAKGGAVPAFHVECGLADSVKISVYTISGRQAHEVTLTGVPPVIDDGNGASCAYEYAWRGHIPSGVYLYYIEAQKNGQKLKKTGKFAVVR